MSHNVLIFLTPIEQELERGEAVQKAKQRVLSSPISYTTKGRPRLEEYPDCALSISHSQHWLAVAIGPLGTPLGIDVEEKAQQAERTLPRYSTAEEQTLLNKYGLPPIQLWTAKEAVYKAHSEQLSKGINQIEMVSPTLCIATTDSGEQLPQSVHSQYLAIEKLYLTVATDIEIELLII